jgi:hypothetical protein
MNDALMPPYSLSPLSALARPREETIRIKSLVD